VEREIVIMAVYSRQGRGGANFNDSINVCGLLLFFLFHVFHRHHRRPADLINAHYRASGECNSRKRQ
jgi:hypothetical protein